jgi:hypothetical protein
MEGVPLHQRKSLRTKKSKKSNDEIDPNEVDTSPLKLGTRVEANFKGRHVGIVVFTSKMHLMLTVYLSQHAY